MSWYELLGLVSSALVRCDCHRDRRTGGPVVTLALVICWLVAEVVLTGMTFLMYEDAATRLGYWTVMSVLISLVVLR